MLSLCHNYGIIPNALSQGLLVPLLKKPTLDPTLPQHSRPVTVSCTLSKLLELYILDVSGYHESRVTYNLGLWLVEAPICPRHWLMM